MDEIVIGLIILTFLLVFTLEKRFREVVIGATMFLSVCYALAWVFIRIFGEVNL